MLVRSHDWGGWATLKVSAELTDGRKIRGKLYDAGETEIRLPKSRPGSHVAAGWLEGRGVYQPDDADDDAQPEGDGHGGDGLTLYEEYRGFQVGDDRVEGDPLVKDLFVLIADPRVKEVEAGLAMYEQGTGINVHTGFGKSQLWMGSMNFNQDGTTPHRVDQHIVTVDKGWDTTRSYVEVVGTPRVCRNVWMLPSLEEHALDADGNRITRREFASTVAHEVSHCSMVAHHGPKKYRVVRWKRGSDGNIYEIDEGGGSTAITVMKEVNSTVPATSHLFDQSFRLAVDETGGQASGDDQCWMRYDNSAAYVSTTSASTRYYIGLQPSGHELCSASVGTGMNSKDHLPQSRFGDAPRGNCAAQLCINDAFANDPTHTR